MTDLDLDRAHEALLAAGVATDTDARFDALYQAVCRMWDHLEDAQEVASAPQTAPEAEAGQGDGGEAVRAAAVRAVSAALHLDACTDDAHDGCDTGDWTREAETALAAAEPHIRAEVRAQVAREIEAMDLSDQYGPLTAHGARADAARIARQEQS